MSQPSNWPLPKDGVRYIVPRAIVDGMRNNPICQDLYPTAFGYYPQAREHAAERNRHDDTLLIYCVRGRGILYANDQRLRIDGGQVVVLEEGTAHRYEADSEDPWTIYWVHFCGARSRDYLRRPDGTPMALAASVGILPKALTDFGALLDARHSTHQQAAFVHAANHLKQLICYLGLPRPGAEDADLVERVHALMLERLSYGLTLEELADAVHLSKHHFARRYRSLTGSSPLARFNELRMTRACRLLDSTAHPVGVVADMLGFGDQYYFSRLFRRVVGLSPTEYRKTHRG